MFLITPQKSVFQNAPNSTEAVFPIDFLAFVVRPAVVGNAHFVNPDVFHPAQLGGDFRFEAEAIFHEVDVLQNISPE